MIKVKISIPSSVPPIQRQTPQSLCIWGDCEFYINEDIEEADYWFVLDDLEKKIETCKCPKEHVYLVTGEPPYVKLYSRTFMNMFAKVFTCQKNLLHRKNTEKLYPLLPWFAGARQLDGMNKWDNTSILDYDYFIHDCPQKTENKIAVITSNKRVTKGHRRRLDFIESLQKAFPDKIDLFGNGFNPIADKYEVLSKYKYTLVMENCTYPTYWTEKIADAFLCECLPLYVGANDINDYFPKNSLAILDLSNVKKSCQTICEILSNNLFDLYYDNILTAKKMVLNELNMFPSICRIIKNSNVATCKQVIRLENIKDIEWKICMKLNRIISK